MITDLSQSHACMLKWQGQVSMLLCKLATSVSLKLYLAILNSTIKPLHQVMLPLAMTMKLTLPEKPKQASLTERLADLMSPDPVYMKPLASESAMLYLTATLYYIIRKTVVRTGYMKNMASMFRVKLTGLRHCINGRKYEGGSKKSAQQ